MNLPLPPLSPENALHSGRSPLGVVTSLSIPHLAQFGDPMLTQTPIGGPFLAIPDMVHRVDFPGGANPVGDSHQEGPTVSTPRQDLAPLSSDISGNQ